MNPMVDEALSKIQIWREEIEKLREIAIECGLTEVLKWKQPCYLLNNHNIMIIGAFKEYCALGFFKGVLLKDKHNILSSPGDNSQAVRQIRFNNIDRIVEMQILVKDYINEAIEIEKSGLKVDYTKSRELILAEELQSRLAKNPAFKAAFNALTPGRQRAYNLYFSSAKQVKTREERVEKYEQQILDGKGLNDCTCGLSKKMPGCDGSHKNINDK